MLRPREWPAEDAGELLRGGCCSWCWGCFWRRLGGMAAPGGGPSTETLRDPVPGLEAGPGEVEEGFVFSRGIVDARTW